MRIWIPTCRTEQVTYNNLPPSLQARVEFLDNDTRIANKRQFILDNCDEPFVMLDDDLRFAVRREDEPTKFRDASSADILALFGSIESALQQYAHVGVSGREGANRVTRPVLECTRMMRILGYQPHVLKANNIRFDRLEVMEDFDVTLRLLKLGYPNLVLNQWVHDQGGSNTKGGCSVWRTPLVQTQNAWALHNYHPDCVTVVRKSTKSAWGGGERTDVRIAWKRAYGSASRQTQVLDTGEGEYTAG